MQVLERQDLGMSVFGLSQKLKFPREVEEFFSDFVEIGVFGAPAGDEDEVGLGGEEVAFVDEGFANEAANVVSFMGFADFFGGDEAVAKVLLPGIFEGGEDEKFS